MKDATRTIEMPATRARYLFTQGRRPSFITTSSRRHGYAAAHVMTFKFAAAAVGFRDDIFQPQACNTIYLFIKLF